MAESYACILVIPKTPARPLRGVTGGTRLHRAAAGLELVQQRWAAGPQLTCLPILPHQPPPARSRPQPPPGPASRWWVSPQDRAAMLASDWLLSPAVMEQVRRVADVSREAGLGI